MNYKIRVTREQGARLLTQCVYKFDKFEVCVLKIRLIDKFNSSKTV